MQGNPRRFWFCFLGVRRFSAALFSLVFQLFSKKYNQNKAAEKRRTPKKANRA
jgi:hypothetical protein